MQFLPNPADLRVQNSGKPRSVRRWWKHAVSAAALPRTNRNGCGQTAGYVVGLPVVNSGKQVVGCTTGPAATRRCCPAHRFRRCSTSRCPSFWATSFSSYTASWTPWWWGNFWATCRCPASAWPPPSWTWPMHSSSAARSAPVCCAPTSAARRTGTGCGGSMPRPLSAARC